MTRRRTPALAAPATLDQALALLNRYAAIAGDVARVEADRDAEIAALKAAADAVLAPATVELNAIVKQLQPWWAVAGDELTGGKRKSMELGGCLLGVRLSNPSLAFAGRKIDKNSEDAAIAALEGAELDHFLRVVTELEKQLLLRAFAAEGDEAEATIEQLTALGFSARQTEQFFVDRLPPKPLATADIALQPEEAQS